MRPLSSDSGMDSTVLTYVGGMVALASGFGSLLVARAAADAVTSEIRSGTILAVLARPVERHEYLLGRFLGVEMLMAVYVGFLCFFAHLLACVGGQSVQAPLWVLIVCPVV